MDNIDTFASLLLEEAKRFLELAGEALEDEGVTANLHAGMVLAFCALEAHINAVSDEMALQKGLTAHEKSILLEREVSLDSGHYKLKNALKMYRLEDRILFLFARFGKSTLDKNSPWWAKLKASLKVRNEISHPKEVTKLENRRSRIASKQLLTASMRSIWLSTARDCQLPQGDFSLKCRSNPTGDRMALDYHFDRYVRLPKSLKQGNL